LNDKPTPDLDSALSRRLTTGWTDARKANDKSDATAGRSDGTGQHERGYRQTQATGEVFNASATKMRTIPLAEPMKDRRGYVEGSK
jgi:hypothetical protein